MTSYPDTLQRGDTISCYQIEEVLGRGGFAVTYLAVDLNLDVHVAIKEYLPRELIYRDEQLNVHARRAEFAEDYDIGLSNFAREAKTLARFKHLNIVRVHQVIHKYNTAYMVMDYEHGQEFAEVLENNQTLPEDDLRAILFPIFDGVEEIHRHGLAHRDIKPSNIYLRDNGSPVLLDFGAARYTMSETTQQLTAVVTVGYTPIEQYNVSENDQGPWSDIYALAAVLYEAVTGEMPVDSVTRASATLTSSSDPLAPVKNKAQLDYSDDFLNAIDWGLKMEAEDRPRSIAQWRDAFNGVFKPATAYQNKRPGRPSKLKTHAKYPPQNNQSANQLRVDNEPVSPLSAATSQMAARVVTRDDENIDDIEIVPLNDDVSYEPEALHVANSRENLRDSDYPDNRYADDNYPDNDYAGPDTDNSSNAYDQSNGAPAVQRDQQLPDSPFASNPAPRGPQRIDENNTTQNAAQNATIQNAGRAAGQTHDERIVEPSALEPTTLNDTLNNIANSTEKSTHTQELRNVLRRDIVKREPTNADAQRNASADQPAAQQNAITNRKEHYREPYPPGENAGQQRTINREPDRQREPDRYQAPDRYREPDRTDNYERSPQRPQSRNEIDFDDTDWDYEAPPRPSRLRWVLPTVGLAAVVGASLLYVNNPDSFRLPGKTPEMTIDTALDRAQQQIDNDEIIFPAGQSALDYYQLILDTDADNAQALAGIKAIEDNVKQQIVTHIDNGDLNEANKLFSRANEAGLNIGALPATANSNVTQPVATQESNTQEPAPVAIDTEISPWVKNRLTTIEDLIDSGNYAEADTLLRDTNIYIPDAELSESLRERIDTGLASQDNQATATDSTEEGMFIQPVDNSRIEPVTDTEALVSELVSEPEIDTVEAVATDSTLVSSIDTNNDRIDGQSLPKVVAPNDSQPSIATSVTPASEEQTVAVIDTTVEQPVTTPPAKPPVEPRPSAPRRSFIAGSGESARHLNQLRRAIEDKNLNRVLQISDRLPAERTEFLRKMFQRYDRLDVSIEQINTGSNSVNAKLNVSMFNKRSDGSYYSAGKWNGVTLSATRQDGQWQKIDW